MNELVSEWVSEWMNINKWIKPGMDIFYDQDVEGRLSQQQLHNASKFHLSTCVVQTAVQ